MNRSIIHCNGNCCATGNNDMHDDMNDGSDVDVDVDNANNGGNVRVRKDVDVADTFDSSITASNGVVEIGEVSSCDECHS
jgi:hypothetical protein